MNERARRFFSVSAVAVVAGICVATSPPPVPGLSDCVTTPQMTLDALNTTAQAHFTYDLSAEGNPTTGGALAANANIEMNTCVADGSDAGCSFGPPPDGGTLTLTRDDGTAFAAGTDSPLFIGCPLGQACKDGATASYALPAGYSGAAVRVQFTACGRVTLNGGNLPNGSTFTVTEP
ncbi:MAG: hypothetical protein JNK82_07340 [Myxococcaceae bacterium]|nr:hypothetical protein [Myxococcaceae bacterium]